MQFVQLPTGYQNVVFWRHAFGTMVKAPLGTSTHYKWEYVVSGPGSALIPASS